MCFLFNLIGRIWNHRRAGGHKRNFRMIDFCRVGGTVSMPSDGVIVEKVDKIVYDPNRTARIALVASGEHKRYIIATENMKAGDVVKSTETLTRSPGVCFVCHVCIIMVSFFPMHCPRFGSFQRVLEKYALH